jgi:hypothetical protein
MIKLSQLYISQGGNQQVMKYAGFVGRGTTDCNIFQGQPDATSFDDWWAQANDRVEEMRLSSAGA